MRTALALGAALLLAACAAQGGGAASTQSVQAGKASNALVQALDDERTRAGNTGRPSSPVPGYGTPTDAELDHRERMSAVPLPPAAPLLRGGAPGRKVSGGQHTAPRPPPTEPRER